MNAQKPTAAYIGASWAVMLIGVLAYLFGLWNAEMMLNEKGYYFTVLAFGLYASISLQKTIRDATEGIPSSNLYYSISWSALVLSVSLIVIGLYNAELTLSEKGFYMMAFTMSLFAAITIQKNTRDLAHFLKTETHEIDKEAINKIQNKPTEPIDIKNKTILNQKK